MCLRRTMTWGGNFSFNQSDIVDVSVWFLYIFVEHEKYSIQPSSAYIVVEHIYSTSRLNACVNYENKSYPLSLPE